MNANGPECFSILPRPDWLKKKISSGSDYLQMTHMIGGRRLNTVCKEACCPNQGECYGSGTATFMILGDTCTRNCRFCAVRHGRPVAAEDGEAVRVAETICDMGLEYAVITSVTRDDLEDGGASVFASVIQEVRWRKPELKIEVLIPDFGGDERSIMEVIDAGPDVLNHNIETVPRLYDAVRPQAKYIQSLDILTLAKTARPELMTKSGLMLGLGEKIFEIDQTLCDLYTAGCDILTIGQYLAPSRKHYPVKRYVSPKEFAEWQTKAYSMGFRAVVAGPFVRSSYKALDTYREALKFLNNC
jgi:lipoic acid synthetase